MPHSEDFADIHGARPIIQYAVRGFNTSDPTQAGYWGVSKVLELDWPGISRPDGGMEPYADGKSVKIKVESMQTKYATVKRALLLCRAMQTVIVQFDTMYFNFVDPYDLAFSFELDVSGNDVILTVTYEGRVLPAQWSAILAAATGAITGHTGGTLISALTTGQFDDTEYGVSGILAVYVGTGDTSTDDELGLKEAGGSKFKMSVMGANKTVTYNKPIVNRVEFKNEVALLENAVATLSRIDAWENTEKVVTWKFANGLTIVLHNCTKFISGPKMTDASGLVLMKNEGSTYLDPVNGTPTNVTFDDGASTIHFYKQGAILP